MRLVVLILLALVFNCSGTKNISTDIDSGLFHVEKQVDKEYILLSKMVSELESDGEVKKERSYTLKVPLNLKNVNSVVSIVPNENELIFDGNQKVLVIGNKKRIDMDKVSLTRDSFLLELDKGYIKSKYIVRSELKKDRFFGIYSNDDYMLIYLNVKANNVPKFNEVLKTQLF